jgi:hypothetical protein
MLFPFPIGQAEAPVAAIHQTVFHRVSELLDQDLGAEAKSAFEMGLVNYSPSSNDVLGVPVLELFARILSTSRIFPGLDSFLSSIDPDLLEATPELKVIQIWRNLLGDHSHQSLQDCRDFLGQDPEHVTPLSATFIYVKGLSAFYSGLVEEAIEDVETAYSLFSPFPKEKGCRTGGKLLRRNES